MSDIEIRIQAAGDALCQQNDGPALALLADCRSDAGARVHVARKLAPTAVVMLQELQDRQARQPDDPDLWLLTGAAQTEAGYRARGYAIASYTSDEKVRGMATQMSRAGVSLRRAAQLLPDDPAPAVIRMTCAQVAGGRGQLHEAWQEVVARGGEEIYEANRVRLVSLTRKWYGSMDDCFAFARDRTRELPDGHPLLAMIALAHVESYLDRRMAGSTPARLLAYYSYLRRPAVRAELNAASKRLLAGAAGFAGHPALPEAHQAFACAYHFGGAHRRARPHLERGGAAAAFPWRYFGDAQEVFNRARAHAR
jgi:hypothetical protein